MKVSSENSPMPNIERPAASTDTLETTLAGATNQLKAYARPTLTAFGSVRELTGGASGGNGDAGQQNMAPGNSDPALKENAVRIGKHPAGFGIWLFDYKPQFRDALGHGRQFGVMADEVAQVYPDAVSAGSDGYLRVDYAAIGVTRH
jgi:hypothetical protein